MGNCVAPPTNRKIEAAPAQKTAPSQFKTAPALQAPQEGEPFRNLFKSFREEEPPKALAPLSLNNNLRAASARTAAGQDVREKGYGSTEADSEINRMKESTDDENRITKSRGRTEKVEYRGHVV